MSLAIVVKGSEGIVLATDSRVTLHFDVTDPVAGTHVSVPATYDNAPKLLKITGQEHVAAVTYGLGTLGYPETRTAHSLLPELEATLTGKNRLSVEEFANALAEFFTEQWTTRVPEGSDSADEMYFVVAGYDSNAPYGRVFDLTIPSRPQPIECTHTVDGFGIVYGGQWDITGRIINGHDPAAMAIIKDTLELDDDTIRDLANKITESSGAKIPFEFLPLQDCVDLCILLIKTTAQLMEYQNQVRDVGGAIDVATITRQDGFRYVQRKEIRGERT